VPSKRKPVRPGRGETIPAPLARELGEETGWELWNRAVVRHDAGFAETSPMTALMSVTPDARYAPTEPAPLPAASRPVPQLPPVPLEKVLLETRRNNRVCPRPQRWAAFHALLHASAPGAAGLPPPLDLKAWRATSSLAKRMCLREQLEWADRHGCLGPAYEFLKSLADDEWHRMSG
jgi:hypothetical protein